ncbi:glycosyltransferase family 2 protein [Shewanella frigidimarina]|uniref:glycosyltransferase family 2 protein n=1 Tax=Shewanella frigidimarina TaxID=56812 RepID=UPI003FA0FBF6
MLYIDYIIIPLIFIFICIPSIMISLELILGQRNKIDSFELNLPKDRSPCVILMPAHNEELVIQETIEALMTQLISDDRLIVIADNCTDRTVEICNKFSIEVIERHNKDKVGKGYALDYGVGYLEKSKIIPNTIVVLDADCQFATSSLDYLVKQCQIKDSVAQSLYLMKSLDGKNVKSRVSEFAWLVKNKIRPTGLSKMKVGCHLQGSGMAFPWRVFNEISFSSGSIVEDLELGLKLANIDEVVLFVPSSIVTSYFPMSSSGTETQRIRWEHGHLSALTMLPKIMFNALLKHNFKALLLALDASIPPTILWFFIVSLISFFSILLHFFELSFSLLLTLPTLFIMLLLFFVSWLFNGRHILKLNDLFGVVRYILSKFSLYKRFVTDRQVGWVRTDRESKDEK